MADLARHDNVKKVYLIDTANPTREPEQGGAPPFHDNLGIVEVRPSTRVTSIRSYPSWGDIAAMVSRSAYAQLDYSPLRLAGTVAAMTLVYLVPPVATLTASGTAFLFGASAWALMAILYQPVLRLYRLSPLWGLALPAVAFAYVLFTIESALASRRGQGGLWKGRFQAARAK